MVAAPAENANKTVETVKERSNMIKSRIASHLSQKEVARIMSVDIKSVINWEKAHTTPHLYQIKPLRDAINFIGSDEELLQIFPVGESVTVQVSGIVENGSEKPAFPQPCRTETNRAILESSGPSPFVIHIPGSVKGFREFMDML